MARSSLRRGVAGSAAGWLARAALAGIAASPAAGSLARVNFRGRTVSLAGGPAATLGATAGSLLGSDRATAAPAAVAGLVCGAVGLYDDVVGARPHQVTDKGFAGHLRALRAGRVSSGLVKLVGVTAAGLVSAALLDARQAPRRRADHQSTPDRRRGVSRAVDVTLAAGLIAGTANLINLLDLRPGRALKASLVLGAPLATGGRPGSGVAAAVCGTAGALLPTDLGEETMLGDSGANALGALLGVALAARTGRLGRATLLAGVVALTAASEKVSFTKVIERTPVLRELDALGRRGR